MYALVSLEDGGVFVLKEEELLPWLTEQYPGMEEECRDAAKGVIKAQFILSIGIEFADSPDEEGLYEEEADALRRYLDVTG